MHVQAILSRLPQATHLPSFISANAVKRKQINVSGVKNDELLIKYQYFPSSAVTYSAPQADTMRKPKPTRRGPSGNFQ